MSSCAVQQGCPILPAFPVQLVLGGGSHHRGSLPAGPTERECWRVRILGLASSPPPEHTQNKYKSVQGHQRRRLRAALQLEADCPSSSDRLPRKDRRSRPASWIWLNAAATHGNKHQAHAARSTPSQTVGPTQSQRAGPCFHL